MPGHLYKQLGGLCVFVWLFTIAASVEAQTVTMNATVSETVALSSAPNLIQDDVHVDVVSSGSIVRVMLSGNGVGTPVIRVPVSVRSNTGFRISGRFESQTARLSQLSVIDVRATGRLVSPAAINELKISPQFDLHGLEKQSSAEDLDVSGSFLVLSGPRVSLGGTLDSPYNALEITLLIRLKSESVGNWRGSLTFFHD